MEKFPTLEEFLLLNDPTYSYPRSIHQNGKFLSRYFDSYAQDMLARYRVAKASWEKYGDAGPPVGCEVFTLHHGFGCSGPWAVRRFDGINKDERCFTISRWDEYCRQWKPSLVLREYWWISIMVKEEGMDSWDMACSRETATKLLKQQ